MTMQYLTENYFTLRIIYIEKNSMFLKYILKITILINNKIVYIKKLLYFRKHIDIYYIA